MKHLQQLNLIPEGETSLFTPKQRNPLHRKARGNQNPEYVSQPFQQFSFGVGTPETRAFGDDKRSTGPVNLEASDAPSTEADNTTKGYPKLSPRFLSDGVVPEPCKLPREGAMENILQRPLPELPTTRPRQASTASLRSNCPSLTPSLMQYVDGDEFDKEEIELDTAQPVLIPSESMQALELEHGNESKLSNVSLSDYADSHYSPEASPSPERPSPESYLPTTGSVLERHFDEFEIPLAQSSPARGRAKMHTLFEEGPQSEDENDSQTDTLYPTEAEWLRHSPSPLRRKSGCVERLWSPRPDQRASDSSSNTSIHREFALSPKKTGNAANNGAAGDAGIQANGVRDPPAGNWI